MKNPGGKDLEAETIVELYPPGVNTTIRVFLLRVRKAPSPAAKWWIFGHVLMD